MADPVTNELIRRYCDAELTPVELSDLETQLAGDPVLRARVEVERRIGERVRSIMLSQAPTAPPGLAAAVRKHLAAEAPAEHAAAEAASVESDVIGRLARLIRGPQKVSFLAVAATLALVFGAIAIGYFGRPIDRWRSPAPIDLVDGAEFVVGEHRRCADDADNRAAKARITDDVQFEDRLSGRFGVSLPATALRRHLDRLGWSWVGGGDCRVPVASRSCHMIFTREDSPLGSAMLSIFVVPADPSYRIATPDGILSLPSEKWVHIAPDARIAKDVSIYSDGKLVYFVVACYPPALAHAEQAIGLAISEAGP